MANIRRLVLDILKPHEPGITEFAQVTEKLDGVEGVNATLIEIDEDVQNIKLTVEGEGISGEDLKNRVEDLGGSVHSIDEIVCGSKMVEQVETPQDK
jgi:hypothetical protein